VLKGRHIPDPFKPKREPSYWHDWIVGMPGFLLVGVLNAATIVVILVLIHHFHKTSWATAVVWRGFNWNRRSPVIYWHFFNIASFIPLLGWIAAIVWSATGDVKTSDPSAPSPETHIRCPECRELVIRDARKCKHCGCALIPQ
jgi:hypothetical protein